MKPAPEQLTDVVGALATLADEQPGCLACHCYREVAEEAAALASLLASRTESLHDQGPALRAGAGALRARLAAKPGTHG